MSGCDDVKRIAVGDEDWFYQAFFDDNGQDEAVRLYDAGGEFVTEFMNRKDLLEYLSGDVPESRIHALKSVREFRWNVSGLREKYGKIGEVSIPKDGTDELREVFIKRFQILKGGMPSNVMAEILGVKQATVHNWATGGRFPGGAALSRIAERCGVTTDWLLGRDE